MEVTVKYSAQVKVAAGTGSDSLSLPDSSTVKDVVSRAVELKGDELRRILLQDDGTLRPSILLFLNSEQVQWDSDAEVNDGAVLTIMSPIAGG